MVSFPNPPVLKTTIIQLNKELDSEDHNYEILTNDYLSEGQPKDPKETLDIINSTNSNSGLHKKKRRRSSANIDSEELAKRKHETKQLHSIIEKRRRIKINREFEALKYLIPACRNTSGSTSTTSSPTIKPNNKQSQNNNGNKIDGMYKLTILKASVEYILYLHHTIEKQNSILQSLGKSDEFDVDFAKVPLDVNQYRNIDKEFSFKDLLSEFETDPKSSSESNNTEPKFGTIHEESESSQEQDDDDDKEDDEEDEVEDDDVVRSKSDSNVPGANSQLLSPDITPDMAPILCMLNKYSGSSLSANRTGSIPVSPHTVSLQSQLVSPLTNPMRSGQFSAPKRRNDKFSLPDPAITSSSTMPEPPRKKYFKSRPPNSTLVFGSRTPSIESEDKLSDQDASKTLLALRKSSIDSLLN